VPKYKIVAHRKVYKFLSEVSELSFKKSFKGHIAKLEDYPLSLREMDTEAIRGVKNTFRLRIGSYRIFFLSIKPKAQYMSQALKQERKLTNKI
jgi:mRNA-degrading endonuclease RelE of RelBE toxin-antitoxin system